MLKNAEFNQKLGSFGLGKTFGGMVGRCMPNSGHGGPLGIRFMTILVFYVGIQIPNIEYFEVYGGLQIPGGISFFSSIFPSNAVRIMSGNLFLTRVMTIYINVYILEIIARSLARSVARSLARSLDGSIARSLARSLARI